MLGSRSPSAAISGGEKIRPRSLESEVELVVKEPRDSGINIFMLENVRQILVVFLQEIGDRRIVEGNDDGVIGYADITVDSSKDGGGKVL